MTSFGYRLNPLYAIKECLSCGALYTGDCSCSNGDIEDKILVPKPPENCARCAKCGHPSCGKGAHIGYNCPPKVPVISNPEPCNQTMNTELPQTLPSFDSALCVSKPNFVDESFNIFNPPPQHPVHPCEFCGNDAYFGHYCLPQAQFNNPEQGYSPDFNFPQNVHNFQQQALSWTRTAECLKWEYFIELFDKTSIELSPTKAERQSSWYNESSDFFIWYTPKSPPVSIGGLYGEYLNKRSALRKEKQKEIDESKREYDLSGRDMTLNGKYFENEEIFKKFSPKNEDLSHSTSEDEPNNKDDISPKEDAGDVYCCDVNGDVSQCFIPANILVEKGDCEHYKYTYSFIQGNEIISLADQRQQDDISKDLSRPFKRINQNYLSRDLKQWLSKSNVVRCKFSWCNDISVDSSFWRGLCGLDDHRKGWLVDGRSLPKFYANNDIYPVAWNDVERVFIPINEPKRHWSLAMFHICLGVVTFYDSEITHDEEIRTWHADHVPKQGGVFGDCGVFLCMFLYRLAHDVPLAVDDPV
uniref:Phospholipase-like protein n=1 Tax=Tanacetum cinerariifolium TaxID=118510 RepID=A0A6L2NZE1_TANCI|nr:phospholipase-like protein [Tanacetum cinerariifolium]